MTAARRRLVIVALAATLAIHAAVGVAASLATIDPNPDFRRYYEIASGVGRPYVDYPVEHPIGTFALFKVLARGGADGAAFAARLVTVNVAADAIIVVAIAWVFGPLAALAYALIALPLLGLALNRVDLLSTACATIAVAAWDRERPSAAALAIAAGTAFKLWPLLFAVLLCVPPAGRMRPRVRLAPLATLFAAALAIGGVWWLIAGATGPYAVVTFRRAHGWQIESLAGAVIHLAHVQPARLESGAYRTGWMPSWLSIAMLATAAPLSMWAVARNVARGRIGTAWLAGVATLLVLSPLLSAQYVFWLAPGAAFAWVEGDRRHATIAVAVIVLTDVFWNFYGSVITADVTAVLIVVARNAVLSVLAISAWRAASRQPGTPQTSDRHTSDPVPRRAYRLLPMRRTPRG